MTEGHPHADLMMIYAQHSKTNAEEWRNWEYRCSDSEWLPVVGDMCWTKHIEYRRKPELIVKYAVLSNNRVYAIFDNREDLNAWFACNDNHDYRVVKLVEVPE